MSCSLRGMMRLYGASNSCLILAVGRLLEKIKNPQVSRFEPLIGGLCVRSLRLNRGQAAPFRPKKTLYNNLKKNFSTFATDSLEFI